MKMENILLDKNIDRSLKEINEIRSALYKAIADVDGLVKKSDTITKKINNELNTNTSEYNLPTKTETGITITLSDATDILREDSNINIFPDLIITESKKTVKPKMKMDLYDAFSL